MLKEKLYDAVIVGSGFGGSIVAAKLAQDGVNPSNGERLKIALIEGGPYYKGKPNRGYGIPLRRQMFTHIPQDMAAGDRSGRMADGFMFFGVGGSSLHWGAAGLPPHDQDYEWWVRETGVDWTKEKMQGAVQEILRMFHSHTIPDELLQEFHFRFRDAAHSMGYQTQKIMVHNKNCIMCGTHIESQPQCRYDAKSSTLLTHIPIAEENGVEILPLTVVNKVILEKRGSEWVATGVWYTEKGAATQKVEAKKVILSAGIRWTFSTPLLLYASGYGPKDLVGNKLVLENPNVGANVDGHPSWSALVGAPTARFDYIVHELGDGNAGFFFLDDKDSQGSDRVMIYPLPDTHATRFRGVSTYALSEWAPEFGHKHKAWMRNNWKEWRHISGGEFYGLMSQSCHWPGQKGRILPDGTCEWDIRQTNMLQRQKETSTILRSLYEKMGAREIRESVAPPVLGMGDRYPFRHAAGACRAGADRKNSVVNSNFECHDIANLFVVDSSVIPGTASIFGGTVVAIVGTFAAQRIIANHFRRSPV